MRPDHRTLLEGQRRDLELGAALEKLGDPKLPADAEARLRSAIEKEYRRNRRRPGWPEWLAVLLLVGVIGGLIAWRYVPPPDSTMQQIRAGIETRSNSLVPTPPAAAMRRGHMTGVERAVLEQQVIRDIRASCTPRFAARQIEVDQAPRNGVQVSDNLLRSGEWSHESTVVPVGDPVFVRRNWDGSLVVRIRQPLLGQVEDEGDLYVFRKMDERWLIDEVVHE